MCFSYSTLREISRGLKHVWDWQIGGTPFSARIIEDVDLALKSLEIFYRANGTTDILGKKRFLTSFLVIFQL